MAEQVTNAWAVVFHDVFSGKSVELVTEPEEIPAIPSGATFTITWDPQGVARFGLAESSGA
jgi:hypothetical protein